MTMLAPRASVTLGNERFDTHVLRLEATLTVLPGVGAFRAFLPSPPAMAAIAAAPGDEAALDLDGGEGSTRVLTGTIRAIRRGVRQTEVLAADAGAALAALRPATTYRNQDANAVVRALAADAEVGVATSEVDLPMAAYVAHQRRTAGEHIAALAALLGAFARINADGELEVNRPAAFLPDVALRYGRELLSYEAAESPAPAAQRVRTGSGPAGSAQAPDALRPTKAPLPAGAADPGVDAVWLPTAILRTPGAAASASVASDMAAAAAAMRVRATAYLLPQLRPGTVVDVQELPAGLPAGPWLLTRVTHVLDVRGGGRTHFEGESAAGFSVEALLSAALGALGGLLWASALYDSIARIARHEARAQSSAGIGVVTEIHPASALLKDHAATVTMRDTGLVLPRVPVAIGVLGFAAIPDIDDVVVVVFLDGDVNAPVIVGRLYDPDREPPEHAEGQLVLALPPGQATPDLELIVDGNEPSIKLTLPGDVEIAITDGKVTLAVGAMKVELTSSGGGRAEIAAGGSKLTLKKDGDITLTSAGKLKLEGTEIEIAGQSKVKVSGAQVEIN